MSESHNLIELISKSEISDRVEKIASDISASFKNETVIFVVVLNGAIFFASDLARAVSIDCKLDFIKVSSYTGTKSDGKVKLEKDLSLDVNGKNIIIIEDIVDTGLTVKYLKKHISMKNPKSIRIASLLLKPDKAKLPLILTGLGLKFPLNLLWDMVWIIIKN
jgi:hypoxanthine phosphoribosyltransferase